MSANSALYKAQGRQTGRFPWITIAEKDGLFDVTSVHLLLVFSSANVCAEEAQWGGHLTACVFLFERIRESRQSNPAGKIIKHTLRGSRCEATQHRFWFHVLCSPLCHFPIDGETCEVDCSVVSDTSSDLKTSLVSGGYGRIAWLIHTLC